MYRAKLFNILVVRSWCGSKHVFDTPLLCKRMRFPCNTDGVKSKENHAALSLTTRCEVYCLFSSSPIKVEIGMIYVISLHLRIMKNITCFRTVIIILSWIRPTCLFRRPSLCWPAYRSSVFWKVSFHVSAFCCLPFAPHGDPPLSIFTCSG